MVRGEAGVSEWRTGVVHREGLAPLTLSSVGSGTSLPVNFYNLTSKSVHFNGFFNSVNRGHSMRVFT